MDIRQLKYFLTIVEEGQITAAAKKLHMAQPPLSQQLMNLEQELGTALFERGSRYVKLTDAGKILMARAQEILNLTDVTAKEINDFILGLNGTLTIGTVSSSGATLLNELIPKFHNKYSGIKFEIYEGDTFTIIDKLNKGIIELGFVRTPFNASNCECRYAKPEPMIAAFSKNFPWKNERLEVSVKDMEDMPLIIYRRFERLIYEVCSEKGFVPKVLCKNDDARTTLLWANAGIGIAIVPKSAFSLICNDNLHFKEIKEEKLQTRISVIWIKNRSISSLAVKFINDLDLYEISK